ncbi:DUF2147 domain-containing protein [Phenylobacterium sp.]|jgi:uncharacterized protein (DUF2147 family)|uniref:DUF2147 domain-containing protein n=1 Tax=Phenylobacterium sp. TaxID=1871053 RepID=UPI0037837447
MRRRLVAAVAAMAAAALSLATPTLAQPEAASAFGVWRNPKDSVRVEIRPCGDGACGIIVWANEKAKRNARASGTTNLVGTQVFRNLELDDNGVWRGRVYVPEMRRTFSGTAQQLDEVRLRAKGCLIGGVLCKAQVWVRVPA